MATNKHEVCGASVLRFADIEILRYHIDGFDSLPLEQKLLVYHLSEAALWGRDIIWDQHSMYGLRIRHILDRVMAHYSSLAETTLEHDDEYTAFAEYARCVWFSSGIHHHYGSDKFVPKFSRRWLEGVIQRLQTEHCLLLELVGEELVDVLDEIFDPKRSPKRTEQSTATDVVAGSSTGFYAHGITAEEVERLYQEQAAWADEKQRLAPPSYGLNSRLAKTTDGQLYEQTYKVGGLYGEALSQISKHLKAALAYTESERQRRALLDLLEYYKTGELEHYNAFCIEWVQDTGISIDFINGFTETYTDPLGIKGSWEGLVHIRNHEATRRTEILSAHAGWFEDNAPIDDRFRKAKPVGVSASVVTLAMLAGDSYPATPIGINLPNADWIRAQYGSKSVTIDNIHKAYHQASRLSGMDETFVPDPAVRELLRRYDGITDELHTDLHECLGHGSGQLLPGVSADALGSAHSTIEETRADLFALYYMADPKLVELGLLPDDVAYEACYYRYLLGGLITQLVRIRPGAQLEEAHMRNRALIARYALERGQAEGTIALEGIQLYIYDYTRLRGYFAELLREVQRIKSEGDRPAAQALIDRYGIEVDQTLHREVLARYQTLDIAPYRGFVNPRLELVWEDDAITDVRVDYTEGYDEQMLRYGRAYATLELDPVATEELRTPEPSQENTDLARTLRQGLRSAMDGIVSSSMRRGGLHYGINFGLTLEHIRQRADTLPRSEDLARYLLSRDVRELKLIGQMIYPSEELRYSSATYLASVSFSNPELRDCLCKHLMDRVADAPLWAMAWIARTEEYHDLLPIAYTILARHFSHVGQVSTSVAQEQMLYRSAMECLANQESPYMTIHQQTALLMLKRWLRHSPQIAERLRGNRQLEAWRLGGAPLQREFAEDIAFELDFK